jgi:hypothetical protein
MAAALRSFHSGMDVSETKGSVDGPPDSVDERPQPVQERDLTGKL